MSTCQMVAFILLLRVKHFVFSGQEMEVLQ